jgi:thiopurine S-methyltransferase
MHHDFWHERWRTRQIGFHQSSPHPFLERWWSSLGLFAHTRVYVPLCGKSLDMVWLAVRGHRVVGSELSPLAVQEFFGEHGASPGVEKHGPFKRHAANAFEILEGDAFQLTPALLGNVDAAYDRAALVALPPQLRVSYVESFARLMPTGSRTLLVAFEYPQKLREGPPFSVEPDEIQQLYASTFEIRELERVNIINESPKFLDQGIPALYEVAYCLTRK